MLIKILPARSVGKIFLSFFLYLCNRTQTRKSMQFATEADKHTWTKADLEAYEYARMRETDDKAEKMLVVEKAERRKQLEIAKNLIALGLDNDTIAKGTDLTVEQIEQLRNEKQ